MSGSNSSPTVLIPGPPFPTQAGIDATGLIFHATGSESQACGNNGATQGSYYFEVTLTNDAGLQAVGVGVLSLLSTSYNIIYSQAQGVAMLRNDGFFESDGSGWAPGAPRTAAGDVVCVAVALPNLVWIRVNDGDWNSNPSASPASGVGGYSLAKYAPNPIVPVLAADNSGVMTANFGQSAFAFPVPALFNQWPGAEVLTVQAAGAAQANVPVALSGTSVNGVAQAIDYSIDGGGT